MTGVNQKDARSGWFRRNRGLSLVEMLVTIAVLGILIAIAIPSYSNLITPSKDTLARNTVETLNNALHRFAQTNYEMRVTAAPGSADEEMLILRTLQYRDPDIPATGSPYMRKDWNPTKSNSTADYRVTWSGRVFTLLSPGNVGSGLKVAFDGTDFGTPYVFPNGYTMAGK